MNLSGEQLKELRLLAEDAAKQASAIIHKYTNKTLTVTSKAEGISRASKVVTEVDFFCQKVILKTLNLSFKQFDLGFLSEEMPDNGSRFKKDYFWCIDPLDGTLPFIESRAGYAVSIALVSQSGSPVIGVVSDPISNVIYSAIEGGGLLKNSEPFELSSPSNSKDFDVCEEGGAVMNACGALEDAPACFYKLPKKEQGGGCLWDYAATACLYTELGAWVSDMHGVPLNLNAKDSVYMNSRGVLFASHKFIAKEILSRRINR